MGEILPPTRTPKPAKPRALRPGQRLSFPHLPGTGEILAQAAAQAFHQSKRAPIESLPDVTPDRELFFDQKAVLSAWKKKRVDYIKTLTALTVEHMAISSALDALAEHVPAMTGNAADMDTKQLKNTLTGVVSVAYVEMLCSMLNLPERTRASILENLNEKIWGRVPPPPVTVNTTGEQPGASRNKPGQSGGYLHRLDHRRTEGKDGAKKREHPPMLPNPFGLMR